MASHTYNEVRKASSSSTYRRAVHGGEARVVRHGRHAPFPAATAALAPLLLLAHGCCCRGSIGRVRGRMLDGWMDTLACRLPVMGWVMIGWRALKVRGGHQITLHHSIASQCVGSSDPRASHPIPLDRACLALGGDGWDDGRTLDATTSLSRRRRRCLVCPAPPPRMDLRPRAIDRIVGLELTTTATQLAN